MKKADVIIIGGGIIGTACAWTLVKRNRQVILIDNKCAGATSAGMGHLVCMDDDLAELTLSAWSLQLWHEITSQLTEDCAWRNCGTLWLATKHEEMEIAQKKQIRMAQQGVISELQNARQIHQREPMLRHDIAGGLWVPHDGIVYAPNVSRWFIEQSGENLQWVYGHVQHIDEPEVILKNNDRYKAEAIVIACGLGANLFLGKDFLRAKKGQLAITDRYNSLLNHQVVELGYGASAHSRSGISVAFNVQPRPTGQLLIGSSRQYDNVDSKLDLVLLADMLKRACHFLPDIRKLNIIRCWSGFRAASVDGVPLIGAHPSRPGLWLALGHEGLGVTTAPASAVMLADLILDERCIIDPDPWCPSRLFHSELDL